MLRSIRFKQILLLISYLLICVAMKISYADELKVAVASNFLKPMKSVAHLYEKETGHQVKISSASTGKLYAQIIHGAPFDLFFAANIREPEKLVKTGYAKADSRFTYATGKIVLWSDKLELGDSLQLKQLLSDAAIKTIAIANPKTAPYGAAAMEVMKKLNTPLQDIRLIRGENINQTWQFLRSGNADIGFVAASQLYNSENALGHSINIPLNLYTAIEQQVVLLSSSQKINIANDFLKFIQRMDIKQHIAKFGYDFVDASAAITMRDTIN